MSCHEMLLARKRSRQQQQQLQQKQQNRSSTYSKSQQPQRPPLYSSGSSSSMLNYHSPGADSLNSKTYRYSFKDKSLPSIPNEPNPGESKNAKPNGHSGQHNSLKSLSTSGSDSPPLLNAYTERDHDKIKRRSALPNLNANPNSNNASSTTLSHNSPFPDPPAASMFDGDIIIKLDEKDFTPAATTPRSVDLLTTSSTRGSSIYSNTDDKSEAGPDTGTTDTRPSLQPPIEIKTAADEAERESDRLVPPPMSESRHGRSLERKPVESFQNGTTKPSSRSVSAASRGYSLKDEKVQGPLRTPEPGALKDESELEAESKTNKKGANRPSSSLREPRSPGSPMSALRASGAFGFDDIPPDSDRPLSASIELKRSSPRSSPSVRSARSVRSVRSARSISSLDSPSSPSQPKSRPTSRPRNTSGMLGSSPMFSLPLVQPSSGNTLAEDLTSFLSRDETFDDIMINTKTPPRSPRPATDSRSRSRTRTGGGTNSSSFLSPNGHADAPRPSASPRETLAAAAASIARLDDSLTETLSPSSPFDAPARNSNGSQGRNSLTRELLESKKRIAVLEKMLNEKDDERSLHRVESLKQDLREKHKTIAGLEAQGLIANKELETLSQAKQEGIESVDAMIQDFTSRVGQLRLQLTSEVSRLVQQRDEIKQQVKELTAAHERAIEESSLLNIKNTQLADMNNELMRQMYAKFGPAIAQPNNNTTQQQKMPMSSSMNNIDSMSSPDRQGARQGTPSAGGAPPPQPSFSSATAEEPMVTILDAGKVVDTRKDRQHARRFWKRPGQKMAKGLNRVFASEESPGLYNGTPNLTGSNGNGTSQSGPGNSMHSITDLSGEHGNGGLGISIPKDQQKQKTTKNGWFSKAQSTPDPNSAANNGSGGDGSNNGGSVNGNDSLLIGVSLEKRIALEGKRVPVIITRCVEEVEKRGITFEGIYRKSGGKSHITSIEDAFAHRQESKYDEVLSGDISGATSALKQYLRYLPVPLVTYDVYDDYIRAGGEIRDVNARVEALHRVISNLPAAHRDTLQVLMRHLAKVATHAEVNRMTSKNLAVVFAPTLARDQKGDREILDMQARNESTQTLIDYCDRIFTGF
uniref:ARAD1C15928p n=1 Tax=Blastobotrys adeninivorans TaxID=409370 RepID=A0A060T1E4_BLAAD